MDRLEKRVIELMPELDESVKAADLYLRGYEPKHNTMRKQMGNVEIWYKEFRNGMFEFVALVRRRE